MLLNFQLNHGRAKNVACIVKREGDTGGEFVRPFIPNAHKIAQAFGRVFFGVDGFHRGQIPLAPLLAHIIGISFLDTAAVAEHNATQILGGRRADNISLKPLLDQIGNVAAMVHVGMGEDEDINF